jgi:hypothetical protein
MRRPPCRPVSVGAFLSVETHNGCVNGAPIIDAAFMKIPPHAERQLDTYAKTVTAYLPAEPSLVLLSLTEPGLMRCTR